MKTTDDSLIGLMVMELLESHWDKSNEADLQAILQQDYDHDDFYTIENVGGDNAHIRLVTTSGKEFRIVVSEAIGSK